MKKLQIAHAAATFVATLAWPAFGGVVQVDTLADLGANDQVLWATTPVSNGATLNVTSTNNLMITLTEATETFSEIQQAPAGGFNGDFPANAFIIDNQWGGPTTITFATAIQGFGVNIDNAWNGLPATSSIDAFNGSTPLGSFQVSSTGLQFLGVSDTVAEITSVTITSDSQNGKGYYAFGDLNIVDSVTNPNDPPGVPEPASAGLALAGAALVVALQRKLSKN